MARVWAWAWVAAAALLAAAACARVVPAPPVEIGAVSVVVIEHASLVLLTARATVWVDPVGTVADYEADFVPAPDVILITHPHADHFSAALIAAVATSTTLVIGPEDVTTPLESTAGFLGTTRTILPFNATNVGDIRIAAIPAYNLDPNSLYHRRDANWNGYVVDVDGEVLYFSGDTEDTPEMRSLEGVTVAFLCMNLPYTMTMDSAAYVLGSRAAISDASGQNTHGSPGPYESIRTPRGSGEGDRNATVEFKPRTVIPYHHRGQDTTVFRDLVNAADSSINVLLLDWYPAK